MVPGPGAASAKTAPMFSEFDPDECLARPIFRKAPFGPKPGGKHSECAPLFGRQTLIPGYVLAESRAKTDAG